MSEQNFKPLQERSFLFRKSIANGLSKMLQQQDQESDGKVPTSTSEHEQHDNSSLLEKFANRMPRSAYLPGESGGGGGSGMQAQVPPLNMSSLVESDQSKLQSNSFLGLLSNNLGSRLQDTNLKESIISTNSNNIPKSTERNLPTAAQISRREAQMPSGRSGAAAPEQRNNSLPSDSEKKAEELKLKCETLELQLKSKIKKHEEELNSIKAENILISKNAQQQEAALRAQVQALQKQLQDSQTVNKNVQTNSSSNEELQDLQRQLQEKATAMHDLKLQLQQKSQECIQLKNTVHKLESQSGANEALENLQIKCESLEAQLRQRTRAVDELKQSTGAQLEELQQRVQIQENINKQIKSDLDAAQQSSQKAQALAEKNEKECEEQRQIAELYKEQIAQKSQALHDLKIQLKQQQQEMKKTIDATYGDQIQQFKDMIAAKSEALEALQKQLVLSSEEVDKLTVNYKAQSDQLERAQLQLLQSNERIEQLAKELQSQKEAFQRENGEKELLRTQLTQVREQQQQQQVLQQQQQVLQQQQISEQQFARQKLALEVQLMNKEQELTDALENVHALQGMLADLRNAQNETHELLERREEEWKQEAEQLARTHQEAQKSSEIFYQKQLAEAQSKARLQIDQLQKEFEQLQEANTEICHQDENLKQQIEQLIEAVEAERAEKMELKEHLENERDQLQQLLQDANITLANQQKHKISESEDFRKQIEQLSRALSAKKSENEALVRQLVALKQQSVNQEKSLRDAKVQAQWQQLQDAKSAAEGGAQRHPAPAARQLPDENLTVYAYIKAPKKFNSPYLQVNRNVLQISKNYKLGYERTPGSLKFIMGDVFYEMKQYVPIVRRLFMTSSTFFDASHVIVLYGAKRSHKKLILSQLFDQLLFQIANYLKHKDNLSGVKLEFVYSERLRTDDEQCGVHQIFAFEEQGVDFTQKLIEMDLLLQRVRRHLLEKQNHGEVSIHPKPCKVREFSLFISDSSEIVQFRVFTSSFLHVAHAHQLNVQNFMAEMLALNSRDSEILHDELLNAQTHSTFIVTLHPLINNYRLCRDTLALIQKIRRINYYDETNRGQQNQREAEEVDAQQEEQFFGGYFLAPANDAQMIDEKINKQTYHQQGQSREGELQDILQVAQGTPSSVRRVNKDQSFDKQILNQLNPESPLYLPRSQDNRSAHQIYVRQQNTRAVSESREGEVSDSDVAITFRARKNHTAQQITAQEGYVLPKKRRTNSGAPRNYYY